MKYVKRLSIAPAAIGSIGFANYAIGHSGGLDQRGCHHDHSNGTYHCHR